LLTAKAIRAIDVLWCVKCSVPLNDTDFDAGYCTQCKHPTVSPTQQERSMKIHVLNHMRDGITVHKVGCRDIERAKTRGELNSDWVLEIQEGVDIARAVRDDMNEGFGWTEASTDRMPWHDSDIKVLPCVGPEKKPTMKKKANSAKAQQETKMTAAEVMTQVAKNNAKVTAAMKKVGVKVGQAMDPKKAQELQDALAAKPEPKPEMTFHLYGNNELHTPSCKRTDALKKKGIRFRKITAASADAVVAKEAMHIVTDTKGNVVSSEIKVHDRCVAPFRKPLTTNPACPHCKSSATVFASNIGVGKKQFSCTGCKKMFLVNKTIKEKAVKVKVSKKAQKSAAMKSDRAAKRAERKAAREQRREDRKKVRVERMLVRASKMLQRLSRYGVSQANISALSNTFGIIAQDAGIAMAKPGRPKMASKKTKATARKK
jgi:transposase-like protein